MTLLSLQNLSVHRGRKTVLSDINLTLREGEVVGLDLGKITGRSHFDPKNSC